MSLQLHPQRKLPVVIVASQDAAAADRLAAQLRADGAVAYAAHSLEGCMRVATSLRPDMVLLDPRLPSRLDTLLRAHPMSAEAQIFRLAEASVQAAERAVTPLAA